MCGSLDLRIPVLFPLWPTKHLFFILYLLPPVSVAGRSSGRYVDVERPDPYVSPTNDVEPRSMNS